MKEWLRKNAFYPETPEPIRRPRKMKQLQVIIHQKDDGTFRYEAKRTLSVKPSVERGANLVEEVYEQEWLPAPASKT